ncbi:hypothetical protein [Streptomyces sp. t39]|uniref:hypothetical protein n=1 Tax=Streptomyces sp. t39 TaxID=1828156 RepID=UPI0021C59FDA|nr:hypothetical protein [Streptomyces sp. t39]
MAIRGAALVSVVLIGLVAGGLWWWAVLRLVFVPEHAGVLEGAVAAGGWGLSLLPVHVAASRAPGGGARRGGEDGISGAGEPG